MKLNILLLAILLAFCIYVHADDVSIDNGMKEEEEEELANISSEDKISQLVMVATATSAIPKTVISTKTIPTNLIQTTTAPTAPTILPDTTVSNSETLTKTTITFEYNDNGITKYNSIATYVPEKVGDAVIKCDNTDLDKICDYDSDDCFLSYDDFQFQSTRTCRIFTTKAKGVFLTGDYLPFTTTNYPREKICRKYSTYTTYEKSKIIHSYYEKKSAFPATLTCVTVQEYDITVFTTDKYTSCYSSEVTSTSSSYTSYTTPTTTPVVIPEDQKITTVYFSLNRVTMTSAVMTVPKTIQGHIVARCNKPDKPEENPYYSLKRRDVTVDTSDRVVSRAFSTKTISSNVNNSSTSSKVVIKSETITTSTPGTIKTGKTIPSSYSYITRYYTERPNPDGFIDQYGNYYDNFKQLNDTDDLSKCKFYTSTQNPDTVKTKYSTEDHCYLTKSYITPTYYDTQAVITEIEKEPITDNKYRKTVTSAEILTQFPSTTFQLYCAKTFPSESIPITITTTTTTTVNSPVVSTSVKTTKCIPEIITITEKDISTVTEKETVTVTVYEDDTPADDSQCASKWAQCGGTGFKGPTCCQSGTTCRKLNEYYSQCV